MKLLKQTIKAKHLATLERTKVRRRERERERERERVAKGQEDREINTNSWSSNDKTKSGEYVLSRPPKKPGGGEVDEVDTTTTISCGTTSTT